ncbi:DNA mismatch repair mutS [Gossypium arboreum]|uniref:DNA mismatch repair mutS n=1 Tax=Gossypium arboreum TaxID=29729 RepID=A0A0B0PJB3_GOSAR|nr:DNA mismatch repair mutS [Gossypium arboreum]
MSKTCIGFETRASVRHVWHMHQPRDIQASVRPVWDMASTCYAAAKVARGSSPYVEEANHTILEAISIASFIILIMACIGTSVFVMVTLFWAKRVACHNSLVILYNAMDGG